MNSEYAALQLRMEDSRKDKRNGEKGLSTLNPHVDGGKGKKVMVYNTKEETEGEKKEKEKIKKGVFTSHNTRACPRILFVLI